MWKHVTVQGYTEVEILVGYSQVRPFGRAHLWEVAGRVKAMTGSKTY